jgi:hypothetical protein
MDKLQRLLTEAYLQMAEQDPNQWGKRELGGPDEEIPEDPNAFGKRDKEGQSKQEKEQADIQSAISIIGKKPVVGTADWSVPAWHLVGNHPYGIWLVDDISNSGEWFIIKREESYPDSGEYTDTEITHGEFEKLIDIAQTYLP